SLSPLDPGWGCMCASVSATRWPLAAASRRPMVPTPGRPLAGRAGPRSALPAAVEAVAAVAGVVVVDLGQVGPTLGAAGAQGAPAAGGTRALHGHGRVGFEGDEPGHAGDRPAGGGL